MLRHDFSGFVTGVLLTLTLALTAGLLAGAAQPSRTADLTPTHDPGREFRFEVESESVQSSNSPVLPAFEARQNLTFKVKVVEGDNAGCVVELIHEHMHIEVKSESFTGSWDSDQPREDDKDNRLGRISRRLIGTPVRVELDGTGEIRRITGLEQLAPGGLDGVLFRQLFSEDAFTSMYHLIFRIKQPPAEAARGVQWRLLDKGGQGLVRVAREYHLTLDRIHPDHAHILIKGVVAEEDEGGAPAGMKAESYELSGWCDWNTELGTLQELETKEHVVFKAAANGVDLSLEGTSKTKLKRLP
ncbi:MAG: hypothetical protein KDA21_10685 [Phycisphaerales bacterium]|nr:hypothetical protein [Phycisphaerales bacterium]